jgi:glycosyltransferase involved in cell wall biosynthesis
MVGKFENKPKEGDALHILMFAPGFAPYSFSENIINSKLALAFQGHGWEIDVISRVDEGPLYDTNWHEPWRPLKGSTHTIEYPLGSRFSRFIDLLRQGIRMRFPVGGLRWAGRALDRAMELHRKHPYQLVLSRAPNDIGHVPALTFSRKTKLPWIANWNDPPAHLWPPPYESAEGLLHKSAARRLLARVFDQASVVTFPSERLRKHILRSIDGADIHRTQVIPHLGLPDYVASERIPDGCFRICHAGNLSRERDPKTFLEGLARFVERTSLTHPFEIRILGTSDHKLVPFAENHGLTNHLKISDGLNYIDTLAVLEQSDVLAVVEAPCEEGIFLPSKVADYAQVGRPLLAVSPQKGTLADLIRETQAGEFAACDQFEAVAYALQKLYTSWRAGRLEQDYPMDNLWERFRPEKVVQQYEEIFSELIP